MDSVNPASICAVIGGHAVRQRVPHHGCKRLEGTGISADSSTLLALLLHPPFPVARRSGNRDRIPISIATKLDVEANRHKIDRHPRYYQICPAIECGPGPEHLPSSTHYGVSFAELVLASEPMILECKKRNVFCHRLCLCRNGYTNCSRSGSHVCVA